MDGEPGRLQSMALESQTRLKQPSMPAEETLLTRNRKLNEGGGTHRDDKVLSLFFSASPAGQSQERGIGRQLCRLPWPHPRLPLPAQEEKGPSSLSCASHLPLVSRRVFLVFLNSQRLYQPRPPSPAVNTAKARWKKLNLDFLAQTNSLTYQAIVRGNSSTGTSRAESLSLALPSTSPW